MKSSGAFTFWVITVLAYGAAFVFSRWIQFQIIPGYLIETEKVHFGWGDLFLLALAIYSLVSIRRIDGDQIAVKELWGFPIQHLNAGPVFAPRLLTDVIPFPSAQIELIIGTPPKDDKGRPIVSEQVSAGSKLIIIRDLADMRITFKGKKSYSTTKHTPGTGHKIPVDDGPLTEDMTCDPEVHLFFKIVDAPTFRRRITSLDVAKVQLRGASQGALQKLAGKTSLAEAISGQETLETAITNAVEVLIGEKKRAGTRESETIDLSIYWGIDFIKAVIASFGTPKRVNEAQADLGAATYKRRMAMQEGIGEGERIKGLKTSLADADGKFAARISLAEKVLPANTKVIMSGNTPIENSIVTGIEATKS